MDCYCRYDYSEPGHTNLVPCLGHRQWMERHVAAERERCAKIVDKLARTLATPYLDPSPINNTPQRIQALHGDLAEIAADAIRKPVQ